MTINVMMVSRLGCSGTSVKPPYGAYLSRVGIERLGQRHYLCCIQSRLAMVGVKKLNKKRMNPCRSVVNNFSIVKIEGWAV
jgi:hypothetical protein